MVDWNSPERYAQDILSTTYILHALAGLFYWEFLISFDFDWGFITRKRPFTWAMVPYFLGRYSSFASITGILVSLNWTSPMDCQVFYIFLAVIGIFVIGCGSLNLAIRTMLIWSMNKYCVIPLCALIIGHWAILGRDAMLTAYWDPNVGCVTHITNNKILAASYMYTICLDFIVLILTAWKLLPGACRPSHFTKALFQNGLIYFVIAFLLNVPAVVLAFLNLNPVLEFIFVPPAAITSCVIACRAVRHIRNYNDANLKIPSLKPTTIIWARFSRHRPNPQNVDLSNESKSHFSRETAHASTDLESGSNTDTNSSNHTSRPTSPSGSDQYHTHDSPV